MKLFSERKTRYRNLILVLLPLLIVIGILGVHSVNAIKKMSGGEEIPPEKAPSYNIPEYSYTLRANCTDIQFEYFQELIAAVEKENTEEGDPKEIVQALVKSYVSDFYTWSNKEGVYDVGGSYYIYSGTRPNFLSDARDYFYHYINYYIDKYGQENLLEVQEVTINGVEKTAEFEVDGMKNDCYYVDASWTYVDKQSEFDRDFKDVFVHHQAFYVIKNADNGRYEIVQIYELEDAPSQETPADETPAENGEAGE